MKKVKELVPKKLMALNWKNLFLMCFHSRRKQNFNLTLIIKLLTQKILTLLTKFFSINCSIQKHLG